MARSKLFQILLDIGLSYNDIAVMGTSIQDDNKKGAFFHEIVRED